MAFRGQSSVVLVWVSAVVKKSSSVSKLSPPKRSASPLVGAQDSFGKCSKVLVIKDGWESEELKDALDTCLSCKGCKSDCPAHVDMASYKAEFLSHYHETNSEATSSIDYGTYWLIGRH